MKQQILDKVQALLPELPLAQLAEAPKLEEHGDIAIPFFLLSKERKQSPVHIAKEYEEKLRGFQIPEIAKVEAAGPYLNIHISLSYKAKSVLENIAEKSKTHSSFYETATKQKILVEYPSPNNNKALHLGHVRNIFLGNSLSKILKKTGNTVFKVNLNNDRGIAICKSLLSYKLWGEGKTPESEKQKSDKFGTYYYTLFDKENKAHPELKLEEKAQELLRLWEAGDKETLDLWRRFIDWMLEGNKETYKNYKISFDKEYFESEIYKEGKEIVQKAFENKVQGFAKDESGAIFVDLEDKNLGKKFLLRSDGTALYMTQDLYLAYEKEKLFHPDKYVFIVGSEQEYHFHVLFELLSRIGFGGNEKNFHLSYGMIYLPEGRMKSREGNVVEADELLAEQKALAKENLKERNPNLSEEELEKRAQIIGYSSLAFFILKFNPRSDFVFNPKESLSFEGETGPYVQYTYARICSILRKAAYKEKAPDFTEYSDKELALINTLAKYKDALEEASEQYKISALAHYLVQLCKKFNELYQNEPILKAGEKRKQALLYLCSCTASIIKDALDLLDIEVLEEM